jgi:hypothetical protein
MSSVFWGWNVHGEKLTHCPYCGFTPKNCNCLKIMEKEEGVVK